MSDFGDKVIRYVIGFFVGVIAGLYLSGNIGVVIFYHQAAPSGVQTSL